MITRDNVRSWVADGVPYDFEYELVSITEKGVHKYIAVYYLPDSTEEFVYISLAWSVNGPKAKIFTAASLFKHHMEFGQGKPLKVEVLHSKIIDQDLGYRTSRSILPENI